MMARRQIMRALAAKGITATLVQYDRQATPNGMMPGWTIELEDECQEQLAALGADYEPDCETASEVMDWIEGLPTIADPDGEANHG